MSNELFNELKSTLAALRETVAAFRPEQLDLVPFEGSWTASQVTEHLLMSYNLLEILNGSVVPTERDPGENVAGIKAMFLNFGIRMQSPDAVLPSGKPIGQAVLLSSLEDASAALLDAVRTLDLSATCLDFSIPEAGEYTRLEWLYFALYHTQRHTRQLKNIQQQLDQQATAV